jgi:hypothetical protein
VLHLTRAAAAVKLVSVPRAAPAGELCRLAAEGLLSMASFNPQVKAKVVRDAAGVHLPCVMCGTRYPQPDAVHIIDKEEWCERIGMDRQTNGMPLCPNCHRVFDEVLRPRLAGALQEFGVQGLPACWSRSNKLSSPDHEPVSDQEVVAPVE